MRPPLRWLLLFFIGAAAGTALDHLHVSFGVLDYPGYPPGWPFAQRPWVPPLFGGATLLFVAGHKGFRAPGDRGTGLRAALAVLLFGVAYFCSARFHLHPRVLFAAMVLGFLPFVVGPDWKRKSAYALFIAVGGVLFETTLVKRGAFLYIAPAPMPTPVWLGGLYLYAAEAARELDLAFFLPAPQSVIPPPAPGES